MAPVKVKIISSSTNKVVTVQDDTALGASGMGLSGLGKKGILLGLDKHVPCNPINQTWIIRPHPNLGPNVFSIHSCRDPFNQVLRYTPLLPANKVNVWANEINTPLQYWLVINNEIRPYRNINNIPNCSFRSVVNGFTCDGSAATGYGMMPVGSEKFYFDVVLDSLPIGEGPVIQVSMLTVMAGENPDLNSGLHRQGGGNMIPGGHMGHAHSVPTYGHGMAAAGMSPGMYGSSIGTSINSGMDYPLNSMNSMQQALPAPSREIENELAAEEQEKIMKMTEIIQKQETAIGDQEERSEKLIDQLMRIRKLCEH